jgi:hypothetical protein
MSFSTLPPAIRNLPDRVFQAYAALAKCADVRYPPACVVPVKSIATGTFKMHDIVIATR